MCGAGVTESGENSGLGPQNWLAAARIPVLRNKPEPTGLE
jgi:hypothetical protein